MTLSEDPATTDKWARLREPFPPEQIETLPATDRRPALSYVSHARITGRLLEVDPEWTWVWGVEDPETGKPSKHLSLTRDEDGSYSLWMALTVLGSTKIDVGYAAPGPEQFKGLVSDAIRRCSMRHGCGLDLWIKTESALPVASGAASSWPARHEKDGAAPLGPPCKSDGCMGTLRERTTKNGDPYLVCSTGKTGCGMSPIWDTSLEDYLAVRGDEDFNNAALDPAEFGEPFPFGDRSPTPIETVLQEGNVTVQSESFATNGM